METRSSQFILVKENYFSTFFTNKILNIRSELGLTDTHTGVSVTNCFSGVPLNTFMDTTEAEIWNIIKLLPVKSCELDPLPTWLLKECKAELIPLITDIVNMSLRESMIPKSLKTAHIRQKTGLDSDILKNYRPISNLTYISKVIEKVISGRLNEHLINNSLFDQLQSAYRDKHSTETALIKVQNISIRRRLISHFADVGSLCCVRHNRSQYLAVTIM